MEADDIKKWQLRHHYDGLDLIYNVYPIFTLYIEIYTVLNLQQYRNTITDIMHDRAILLFFGPITSLRLIPECQTVRILQCQMSQSQGLMSWLHGHIYMSHCHSRWILRDLHSTISLHDIAMLGFPLSSLTWTASTNIFCVHLRSQGIHSSVTERKIIKYLPDKFKAKYLYIQNEKLTIKLL